MPLTEPRKKLGTLRATEGKEGAMAAKPCKGGKERWRDCKRREGAMTAKKQKNGKAHPSLLPHKLFFPLSRTHTPRQAPRSAKTLDVRIQSNQMIL